MSMNNVVHESVPQCWDGREPCTDNGQQRGPSSFEVDYLYIGKKARLVATDSGCNVEIKNSSGQWIVQREITEL